MAYASWQLRAGRASIDIDEIGFGSIARARRLLRPLFYGLSGFHNVKSWHFADIDAVAEHIRS
jgi:hypothetical protein